MHHSSCFPISFKGFDHIATALTYFKRVPPTTYTLLSKSSGSVLDRKVPVSTLTKAFKTPLLSLSVEEREEGRFEERTAAATTSVYPSQVSDQL